MKTTSKLARSLSGNAFALLTLIISCTVVAAGLFWQQQSVTSQLQAPEQKLQQQTLTMLNNVTSAQIMQLKNKLVSVSLRAELATILANADTAEIERQQNALSQVFPNAKSICLIGADVDDVDKNACIPITYATLDSLRQAKKEGSSPIALMQVGTESAHLLVGQRITDQDNNVVGVLMLTFSPDVVKESFFKHTGLVGYAELQQGSTKTVTLAAQGNVASKQGVAPSKLKLTGTHWRIAYWPEVPTPPSSPLFLIMAVLGVMILMWLLREALSRYVHKLDVAALLQQIDDLKNQVMKPKYVVTDSGLQNVSADIGSVGLILTSTSSSNTTPENKTSTSDIINKKLDIESSDDSTKVPTTNKVDIDQGIFKAYDIRGIVGESLNDQVVETIGRAIGSAAIELGQTHLVVGRDGRHSSPKYSESLISGILASGCDVSDLGMVPTPVLYFASHYLKLPSAVMVTGSHNPANYNGLKIISAGQSLAGDDLQALYQRIQQGQLLQGQGTRHEVDVTEAYSQRVTSDIQLPRQIKVVLDCGNGVAGSLAPILFRALGCDVIELYCNVDGDFPNHSPDPSQPDNLQDLSKAVQEHGAELGIAFDGDGDRLGVVDAMGNVIFPDRLMVMFAQDVLQRMPGSTIIYDVKSSNLLGEEISKAGGQAIMWQSGHSLIKNKMAEVNAQLAGELSGHIFFKERWYGFDDAIYAAARLLELIGNDSQERTPTEIFAALPNRVSTPEILLAMEDTDSKEFIAQIQKEGDFSGAQITTIDGLRADYVNGWGLVRASNTVPGLTLRFEADTQDDLYQIQERFKRQMLQIKPTLTVSFSGAVSVAVNESQLASSSVNEPMEFTVDKPSSPVVDEPMAFTVDKPSASAVDEPMDFNLDEPSLPAADEPMDFNLDEPSPPAADEPMAFNLDEPSSLAVDEPMAFDLDEPSPLAVDEAMAFNLDETPPSLVDEPVTVSLDDPLPSTADEPQPLSLGEPLSLDLEEASDLTQKDSK